MNRHLGYVSSRLLPILGLAALVGFSGCGIKPQLAESPSDTYKPSDAAAASQAVKIEQAPPTQILTREPWKYSTADGEVLRTTHYRIFTTADDKVLRTRMASFLEHALLHYRTALGPLPEPPSKLETYLMNNRPQWERITQQLMGPQAEMLLKIPRGGYASRGIGVFYNIGLFDTLAISAHEGWHQYTQRTFKDSLPAWLEEGLATYMEGHRWEHNTPVFRAWANVQRYDQLRKAANDGNLLALPELLESRPQDFLDQTDDRVLTFYAQLWALTHFLNEGSNERYRASLREVLSDASSGQLSTAITQRLGARAAGPLSKSGVTLFMAYFNQDIDAATSEYGAFLEALTQTGARGPIVEGRSPIQGTSR